MVSRVDLNIRVPECEQVRDPTIVLLLLSLQESEHLPLMAVPRVLRLKRPSRRDYRDFTEKLKYFRQISTH